MTIAPLPSQTSSTEALGDALDGLSHAERLLWAYSLDEREQLILFEKARGRALSVASLVPENGLVTIYSGRNGLPLFNRFQKRFARLGDEVVGYNHNPSRLLARLIGPGHFIAYDSPDAEPAVWIDYRRVPSRRHPTFPKLLDNEGGLRGLVYGNMVDVLRPVSEHVFIGNAFKDKSRATSWSSRLGSKLPAAPFVVVRVPAS